MKKWKREREHTLGIGFMGALIPQIYPYALETRRVGDVKPIAWSFDKSQALPIIGCTLQDDVWTLDERTRPSSNQQGYFVRVKLSQV